MKYRIRSRYRRSRSMPVNLSDLFDFGILYDPSLEEKNALVPYPEKRKRARLLAPAAARLFAAVSALAFAVSSKIRARLERKRLRPSPLPALCGALCAALAVALVSLGAVVFRLVITPYFGSYRTIAVPDLVGLDYLDTALSESGEDFEISVSYEYSSELAEGRVLSQSPAAGTLRRIYSSRSPASLSLVISLGEKRLTMNDYTSHSLREALLELKRESVRFSVSEDYSDSVEQGKIISTSPAVGESFSADDTVNITVSLGKKITYVSVPDLYGLSESRALALISASGLTHSATEYIPSSLPRGTVISQSLSPYSSVPEQAQITLSVSAGEHFSERLVPDLFGLTLEEAKAKLAEYGLVCGNVYSVANGASSGRVIAQTPTALSPISAGLVAVDIYISQ